jgi:cell division protein FtsI (penicillin-binding protein 3)
MFFISVIVFVLIFRFAFLMIVQPSKENIIENSTVPEVQRGQILDINGKTLAITTTFDSVAAWVPYLEDVNQTANLLSEILNLEPESIIDKLASHTGFVWIKRKISSIQSDKIKELQAENLIPGITLKEELGRRYPNNMIGSHLIGYVGIDNNGLEGIEWCLEKELSPVKKDTDIIFGNQVFLTIDTNIQFAMEEIALNAYELNRADSVMLLAMEAKTGNIIAYVSIPHFDPNNYSDYDSSALLNRPIRYAYEPGSVFKIFSLASFMELGGITTESTFYCNGYFEDTENNIKINCLGNHGIVTVQNILEYSCNAGASYASTTVSSEDFYDMLTRFGFGKPTGVLLSGESSGILRKPENWSLRTKPTISFGQEISVSALQIITAATALANNGILIRPHLVSKIVSPEGKILNNFKREEITQVVSPYVANEILLMMESACASRARIDGLRISAKTGTAQVNDPETGTYSEVNFVASILGIFPTNDPEYIIYVVISNPKDEIYGSKIAAPVFKEAAEKLLVLLNLPTDNSNIEEHSGTIYVNPPLEINIGSTMPDLYGTPKRLLLNLFNREELTVFMHGEGYVKEQSPAPGSLITEDTTIILEFE